MKEWELVVIVVLFQALMHYLPWRMLLRGKELPRLAAYTLGSLGMVVPFGWWLWQIGAHEAARLLLVIVAASGLTVFALYGLDHYLDLIRKDIEASEREKVLMEQIKKRPYEQGE